MSRQIEVRVVQILAEWLSTREDISADQLEAITFHLAGQPNLTVIQPQDTVLIEMSEISDSAPTISPNDSAVNEPSPEPNEVPAQVFIPGACLSCRQVEHASNCRFAEA